MKLIIVSRIPGVDPAPDSTAPTAPTISAAATSTTAISITLVTPSTDVGGSGVASYTLQRATDAAFTANLVTTNLLTAGSFPLPNTGLTSSTQYFFRLRAVDVATNIGAFSATVNATTQAADTTAPTAPVISVAATSSSSITVTLVTPSTDTGGSGVASYTLQRATDAGFTANLVTTNGLAQAGFPLPVTGLTNSTLYFFRLRAVDVATNIGAFSTAVNTTTQTGATGTFDEGTDTGTQRYVRPNGATYGTGNGSSWTNAWSGFSGISWATVAAGDTIWIAGGTYTQDLIPAKSGTSTNPIKVRRARSDSTQCTGAAGWTAAFDSTIEQVRQSIIFNSFNWITVSGATSQSGGTQGWHINHTGATSGTGIEWPNGSTASNIVMRWIDVEGPGRITYSSDGRGIDATPINTGANNITFGHMKIHDWESTAYFVGISNVIVEYCEWYGVNAANPATFHPNMIYCDIEGGNNLIFRYNRCHGDIGEGIFWTNSPQNVSNVQIYGNVWYDVTEGKCLQPDNTGSVSNWRIWNNTFESCPVVYTGDGPSSFTSSELRNNIFSRSSSTAFPGGVTASNNLTTTNASVFVDRAAKDYHIPTTIGAGFARNAGTPLTSDGFINKDPDGNTRGADGTWDIGAYEFV